MSLYLFLLSKTIIINELHLKNVISLVPMTIGKQDPLEHYGIAYAVWSLLLGMAVTNCISPSISLQSAVGNFLTPIS
jgi:hypothetical protein